MQNTYEKILKYLIEHDVELTIIRVNRIVIIKNGHNGRFVQTKVTYSDFIFDNNDSIFYAVRNNLSILFPSFKDFDTPIKGI